MFDKLFGYQQERFFHSSLVSLVRPDFATALSEALHMVIEENQIRRLEVVAVRSDNTTFHAEIGLSLIKDDNDPSGGIVCNLHDITGRKQVEEQLLKTLQIERELNDLRSRFVSMVSHEFRTPLTSIVSSSELLEYYLDYMDAGQKGKHFDKIRGAIQYMTQLLDDTLILGRAEAGRLRVNPQPLDLEQLYQAILGEVQPGAGPGIRFVCHTTGDCSSVLLDDKLLHHILSNLLSNAAKYSPRGGTVSVEIHCDGEQTTIRVSDEGIGIPRPDREHLFEPFHRGENVGNIKGTGLGLAIAQRAVNLHNGTISVESEVGVGTTFTVTIPNTL
jgi:PAS domain S-box-containing protein